MTPEQAAAVCVSLAAGRSQAAILAEAIRNALASYRANHGRGK